MRTIDIDPAGDAHHHIRVHPKGKTKLGRYLVTSAITPFTVEGQGRFKSFDAYRIWRCTGMTDQAARELYGAEADVIIRQIRNLEAPVFQKDFKAAFEAKLRQTMLKGDVPFGQVGMHDSSLYDILSRNQLELFAYDVEEDDALPFDLPSCMTVVFARMLAAQK